MHYFLGLRIFEAFILVYFLSIIYHLLSLKVDSKTKKKAMMAHKKKTTTTMKATPVSGLSLTQSATKVSEPLSPLAELFKSLVVANTW